MPVSTHGVVASISRLVDWDISQARPAGDALNVGNVGSETVGSTFSADGANLYVIEITSNKIHQFVLSTPWDIFTASSVAGSPDVSSFSLASEGSSWQDVNLTPDGTKMYVLRTNTSFKEIHQYSLSTPFAIGTATYDSKVKDLLGEDGDPACFAFKSDGTRMFMIGTVNHTVYQYDLSTAWDISSAALSSGSPALSEYDVSGQISQATGIDFSPDGTKMYIMDFTTDSVQQYTLGTAWDITTTSYDSKSLDVVNEDTFGGGVRLNSDGTRLYYHGLGDIIYAYVLSTPWDISTGEHLKRELVTNPPEAGPLCSYITPDGTMFYVSGNNDTVYQYHLSIPWDLNTAVYGAGSPATKSFYVGSEDGSMTAFTFKPDGTKLYFVGLGTNRVYQYELSTPWEVSTASKTAGSPNLSELHVGDEMGSPVDLVFSSDGTRLYVLDSTTKAVYQYELSTPWDVSTGAYGPGSPAISNFVVGDEEGTPYGIAFNPNGLQMFMVGLNNNTAYRYTLSTAWDISTASYDNLSVDLTVWDGTPVDINFSVNGFYMYFVGSSTDTVYQFALYNQL